MFTELGWNDEFEHVTPEGFSLDLANPEAKRAIEVDGPSHYLKDASAGDYIVKPDAIQIATPPSPRFANHSRTVLRLARQDEVRKA